MPTPQNGQIHSNNSSAISPTDCFSVFDHFMGLALKGLILERKILLVLYLQSFEAIFLVLHLDNFEC